MKSPVKPTTQLVGRFLHLPKGQKAAKLHALMLLVFFRLALWVVPYRLLRRLADRRLPTPPGGRAVDRITGNVREMARFVPFASCLTQGLAAMVLLHRHGFDAELRLGVAHDKSGAFKAHAWIEYNDQIVLGDLGPDMIFTALRESRRPPTPRVTPAYSGH